MQRIGIVQLREKVITYAEKFGMPIQLCELGVRPRLRHTDGTVMSPYMTPTGLGEWLDAYAQGYKDHTDKPGS